MKNAYGWTLALLLLALCGCATGGQVAKLALPARHAILTAEQAQVGAGFWRPTEADIAVLEEQLCRIWVKGGRGLDRPPSRPLSNYLVRYIGQTNNGRRVIVGEGCDHAETQVDWLMERTNMRMVAFGGGEGTFTVTFDVEAQRVTRVQINAPL
jgi:hypothetical protein